MSNRAPERLDSGPTLVVRHERRSRPVSRTRRARLSRRLRHPLHYRRFWIVTTLVLLLLAAVLAAVWVAVRAVQLLPVADRLKTGATSLETQARDGDWAALAATMTTLRGDAQRARDLTHDPAWWLAARLPAVGDDVTAVRGLTVAAADVTEAARPLETAIPAVLRTDRSKGVVDPAALKQAAAALPALATAVDRGVGTLDAVDPDGVVTPLGDAVTQVRNVLRAVEGPVTSGGPALETFADLLGASGPRTTVVLLQQNSEARGTGGLVGAYALLTADDGRIDLLQSRPRQTLQTGPKIPRTAVPKDVRDLWNRDLEEWAGLNLSPHFPWTGQLVAAGWERQPGLPEIDAVVAIDQNVFAGLLAATGPVEIDGVRLDAANAGTYLSKDIYARYPDYTDVDRAVGRLVQATFARLVQGQVSLGPLVSAMRDPVAERRVLIWSKRPEEQQRIERTAFSGIIPDRPGPFFMPVVNNGGGNKMDAYLEMSVDYQPGECTDDVRIGLATVTLESTAPESGLPDYVVGLYDAANLRMPGAVPGQNKVLLDLYAPVGSSVPVILVNGKNVNAVQTGTDRNHSVFRIAVPLPPGTTRQVEATIIQNVTPQDSPTATVLTQPMVNPVAVTVGDVLPCGVS